MVRQKKKMRYCDKEKKTNTIRKKIQLEEINQKVLAKEGRLKRYGDRTKQYRQNGTFQTNERKFYQQRMCEYTQAIGCEGGKTVLVQSMGTYGS